MELHTITIKDIRLNPIVGVYEHERTAGQAIVINLKLEHTRPATTDDLATTLDYDTIVEAIETYAQQQQPYLIETIAREVAALCLAAPLVQAVEVEVQKPAALKNGLVSVTVRKTV